MKDMQRQRLYNSEAVLRTFAKPLIEIRDIEKYVERILNRQSVLRRWPDLNQNIRVLKPRRGQRRALAYGSRAISLPLWSRNEAIVIHEVAHTIVSRVYRREVIASHGWQFAMVMLILVKSMMGKEAHDALRQSYKDHKVAYFAPRAK